MSTLVIVNPQAGSGRAGKMWAELEPHVRTAFGELQIALTQTPDQALNAIQQAHSQGLKRILAVGGDGTTNSIMNILLQLQETDPSARDLVLGQLPIGTGQDFARVLKIPKKPDEAVAWLAQAEPQPIDVGELILDNQRRHFFLNIASVGVSGAVDERVNAIKKRRPWTFWWQTVLSFLQFQPPPIRVMADGKLWYEGKVWLVAVANGTTFGKGMAIAPHALVYDGLFDVILVKESSRLRVLQTFNSVYGGKHLTMPEVEERRVRELEIQPLAEDLLLDLDGESATGRQLHFTLKPQALQMLYRKN